MPPEIPVDVSTHPSSQTSRHPWIERFWISRSKVGEPITCFPDGSIDLVFEFAAQGAASRLAPMQSALLAGIRTRPHTATPSGLVIGARLRAGGTCALFGIRASEATDADLPLKELVPRSLWNRFGESSSDAMQAMQHIESTLFRLGSTMFAPVVAAAVSVIERERGQIRIAAVARRVGATRQHLAREFDRAIGVPAKMYCRIVRLREAMRIASLRPRASWSALAAKCGYADQAHLISEFKALAGVTPERWFETFGPSSSPPS